MYCPLFRNFLLIRHPAIQKQATRTVHSCFITCTFHSLRCLCCPLSIPATNLNDLIVDRDPSTEVCRAAWVDRFDEDPTQLLPLTDVAGNGDSQAGRVLHQLHLRRLSVREQLEGGRRGRAQLVADGGECQQVEEDGGDGPSWWQTGGGGVSAGGGGRRRRTQLVADGGVSAGGGGRRGRTQLVADGRGVSAGGGGRRGRTQLDFEWRNSAPGVGARPSAHPLDPRLVSVSGVMVSCG